jgi:hypothetical protein
MHPKNDMRTHSQVGLQPGAEIVATAKTEKKNKDTTGAVRSDIWCSTALWVVVGLQETGNGNGAGKYRLTERSIKAS